MDLVKRILADGAQKANKFAQQTLNEVLYACGLKNKLNYSCITTLVPVFTSSANTVDFPLGKFGVTQR